MKVATGTGSTSCRSPATVSRLMRARMRRLQNSSSAMPGVNRPRNTPPSASSCASPRRTIVADSPSVKASPASVNGPTDSVHPRSSAISASSSPRPHRADPVHTHT